jgi:hypothetical protein
LPGIFEQVNWLKYKKNSCPASFMIPIQYPQYAPRLKQEGERDWIFDPLRRKWVRLTPEEWVRQHFMQYLIQTMQYPASLIAVEKEILLGERKKRFDILVYKDQQPWLMVECKEMNTPLTEQVVSQVLQYNISLQVQYLIITNGKETRGVRVQAGSIEALAQLPAYG